MSQQSIYYSPPSHQASFLFYKRPSKAWTQRFTRLRILQDLSASVRFTMERPAFYEALSSSRAQLLPKFGHCVAIANPKRYKRTLQILGLTVAQPQAPIERLLRKERSLEELESALLPTLRQNMEGLLEIGSRVPRKKRMVS